MSDAEKYKIALRIDPELVEEIDARIELMRAKGKTISRNQWFENMTRWVVYDLPYQARQSDLIKAWPNMPEEALRVDQ